MPSTIARDVLLKTFRDMRTLRGYWHTELPLRVHQRALDSGGAPDWHPDFAVWLTRGDQFDDRKWRDRPEPRTKSTRAMRKLRKWAPREYEVVYRTAILAIPFEETIEWLNMRASRGDHPERYDLDATLLLLISGVDKWAQWFSV